jgi:hypothetical protein
VDVASPDAFGSPDRSPAAADARPEPVVRIELEGGHVVSIYDAESRAMVTEDGKADGSPSVAGKYRDLVHAGRLVELFSALQPGAPVPDALRALESRLQPYGQSRADPTALEQADPQTRSEAPVAIGGGSEGEQGHGKIAPLDCGSNCCNDAWLQSTMCGFDIPQTHGWYYPHYGWSYEYGYNVAHLDTAVCAEIGTTQYLYYNHGENASWQMSIAQGDWHWTWWTECNGWGCGRSVAFRVQANWQTQQALHTLCGSIW